MKIYRQSCAFFVVLAFSRVAAATTFSWDGNGAVPPDGNFNVANNWNLNTRAPGSSDTALFNLGVKKYTVSFPGSGPLGMTPVDYITDRLLVGNTATVTFANVDALSTYTVNNATTAEAGRGIIIGQVSGDKATLNTGLVGVTGLSGVAATIGDAAGSQGTLNVSGKFNLSGELIIGNFGTGTLNVTAGATVSLTGSSGDAVLGINVGSNGTATVSGVGSTWNVSDGLVVGSSGSGTLNITDSGHVNSGQLSVLSGMLNITSGGQVSSGPGSTSTDSAVHVDGLNSKWTINSRLKVGNSTGNSTLSITGGGRVTSVGVFAGTHIYDYAAGNISGGTVTIDGAASTWKLLGDNDVVWVGVSAAGSLSVTNDGAVDGNGVVVSPLGLVQGNGNINVDSYIANYGIVAPGNSLGALHINGDYVQRDFFQASDFHIYSAGTLRIELGGTNAGIDYDQLLVSGELRLTGAPGETGAATGLGVGGTLDIALVNAFAPHEGDSFNILDFTSQSGTFHTVNLPGLTGSLQWDTSQLYISGVLSIVLPGDFNQNGVVDAADYIVWRKNVGTSAALPNDLIGGTIGTAQYNQWRANFGRTAPGVGSSPGVGMDAAVPEPSTLVLLIFGVAGWHLRRGRAA